MTDRLSPHLTLPEWLATDHRQYLDEQEAWWLGEERGQIRQNTLRFATTVFEPVRAILGPLRVNSGLRCPELNTAIGGARASRHVVGLAADVVPLKVPIVEAMSRVRESIRAGDLPGLDRVIFECSRWLHLQAPLTGERPAGLSLMFFGDGSGYPPFDITDPRVIARRRLA